jgi:hypothetical protein
LPDRADSPILPALLDFTTRKEVNMPTDKISDRRPCIGDDELFLNALAAYDQASNDLDQIHEFASMTYDSREAIYDALQVAFWTSAENLHIAINAYAARYAAGTVAEVVRVLMAAEARTKESAAAPVG